jgi:integrase
MALKVALKNSNGWIQLVYRWDGSRRYLSIGLEWNKANCSFAQLKAAELAQDLLLERFDPGRLGKYKAGGQAASAPVATAKIPELKELWAEYCEYRRPKLSQSTLHGPVRMQSAIVQALPYGLDQPAKIRDWIDSNYAPTNAARSMQALNACCRWAAESGRLAANPLDGLRISIPKQGDKEIDPFTTEERDLLLETIAVGDYWAHYHRLIAFLFFTGCRPSEAVALEWGHIASDRKSLTFCQAATLGEHGGIVIKSGLKTQRQRRVPLNDRVNEILGDSEGDPGLVFPAIRDGIINTRNMAKRIWYPALGRAGLKPRNLYQTRHTFITLALQQGIPIPDIAAIVGNSPQVILEHYAGVTRSLSLPSI